MEFSQEMTRARAIRIGQETLTRPEGGLFLPIRRDALATLIDAAQGHPTEDEVAAMWEQRQAERPGYFTCTECGQVIEGASYDHDSACSQFPASPGSPDLAGLAV